MFRAIEKIPQSRFDPQVWSDEMKFCGLHTENPWLYQFILDGVTNGFPIFVKPDVKLDKTHRNLPTSPMDDLKIT